MSLSSIFLISSWSAQTIELRRIMVAQKVQLFILVSLGKSSYRLKPQVSCQKCICLVMVDYLFSSNYLFHVYVPKHDR